MYQSAGRGWAGPRGGARYDTTSTDSEEVDSDSGYSSPLHRRKQAASGTHPPAVVPGVGVALSARTPPPLGGGGPAAQHLSSGLYAAYMQSGVRAGLLQYPPLASGVAAGMGAVAAAGGGGGVAGLDAFHPARFAHPTKVLQAVDAAASASHGSATIATTTLSHSGSNAWTTHSATTTISTNGKSACASNSKTTSPAKAWTDNNSGSNSASHSRSSSANRGASSGAWNSGAGAWGSGGPGTSQTSKNSGSATVSAGSTWSSIVSGKGRSPRPPTPPPTPKQRTDSQSSPTRTSSTSRTDSLISPSAVTPRANSDAQHALSSSLALTTSTTAPSSGRTTPRTLSYRSEPEQGTSGFHDGIGGAASGGFAETEIVSAGRKRRRRRSRRKRRDATDDWSALSDEPLDLARAHSSSNVSRCSDAENAATNAAMFDLEQEFPDLSRTRRASGPGALQQTASGGGAETAPVTFLTYSDILKKQTVSCAHCTFALLLSI